MDGFQTVNGYPFSLYLCIETLLLMNRKKYLSLSLSLNFTLTVLIVLSIDFNVFSQSKTKTIKSERPTVGLVLSGGGAKGFAYIGLLKVIQEAGLRIDYIGGTSIGSIMGGLYAIGYHPDSIAAMIREQNWDHLLKDEIDRKYIAYNEKKFGEKFIVTLPVKDKKIAISPSLYQGQQMNLLLNRYFSPAYNVYDFKTLQTPFLCIGTNLLNGEEVVLDRGYLPMAIRSSMSIPGYFSPTDYMDYYLVDGGVVDNYPAKDVKKMGAQIIVGGDVQSGLIKSPEELNSLIKIIDQITAYHREKANKQGYELTNLYVPIKMNYGMMSFNDYDSIIAIGERVSRKYFNKIKALADSLNAIEYKPIKTYNTKPLDSIFIDDVIYKGYNKMPVKYFENFFDEKKNSYITLNEIEENITLMYGSRFFKHVFYKFEQIGDKTNLVIDVKEGDPGYISAGVHYDNDYLGSFLINGSFRNVFGKRTKLFTDLVLGVNPRLRALYMIDNGAKPGFGVKLNLYSFDFDDYDKNVKINTFNYTNYKSSVFVKSILKNLYSFKVGFDYEYFQFKQKFVVDSLMDEYKDFSSYGTLFVSFGADTRNHYYFPTKGFKSQLRFEYVMPLSHKPVNEVFDNSFVGYVKYDQNIKLSTKFVLRSGLFAGGVIRQDDFVPFQHCFAAGGLNPDNYVDTYVDFTGVHFIQSFGYYMGIVRMKLQYNFFKKMYFTLRADAGANETVIKDVFKPENFMCGYGLTYSYDSFIGPVELTVMGSNLNPELMLFINLGFWF